MANLTDMSRKMKIKDGQNLITRLEPYDDFPEVRREILSIVNELKSLRGQDATITSAIAHYSEVRKNQRLK